MSDINPLKNNKHIYFASDLHLGLPNRESSLIREQHFINWLEEIAANAQIIYLVGDIFDFWFEYREVVPKGFVRLIAKLSELKDKGIEIELFTGNHDLWMNDYFVKEFNIPVHHAPIRRSFNGKEFYIGHGDGLGPGDNAYKILKRIFTNPLCKWGFRWLHPDIGMKIAHIWSNHSKDKQSQQEDSFKGNEKEALVQFSIDYLKKEPIDYFIFGHRHLALNIDLNNRSKYVNLGDWIKYFSYAKFDGQELDLFYYPMPTTS